MPARKTSAKTAAKSTTRKQQDAIGLLTADHKAVMDLFTQFEKAKGGEDEESLAALVQEICSELTVHATVEEEIFYPAVQAAIDDDDLMDEAEVEHASAKELISQLEEMEPGDPLYAAKVTVLSEYVRHHVGEEEGEMFKKARQAEKDEALDLAALGAAIQERKEALLSEMEVDEDAPAGSMTGRTVKTGRSA